MGNVYQWKIQATTNQFPVGDKQKYKMNVLQTICKPWCA